VSANEADFVREQYATPDNLRARKSAYTNAEGDDPREFAFEAIAAEQPRRVLEVGGGEGELAERVHGELGAEVIGVDQSAGMVEAQRAKGIDARPGDVQHLPFADGEFDVAVAAWMLYHVPDLERGLSELARVLRPGGRLVVATNSALHLQELRELVGSGPWLSTFTRENGAELLGRHFARVRREDVEGRIEFATRREVEEYVRASISMSPFAGNLPAVVEEPFPARRAVSIFVADKAG
jgi:SAM-dependent methyltransferase